MVVRSIAVTVRDAKGEAKITNSNYIDLVPGSFWASDPDTALTWLRANDPVHHHEPTGMWGITSEMGAGR